MKIALSTDSCVDLPQELLTQYNINTVSFGLLLGDKEYNDGELSIDEIFSYVDKNKILPKTSAVNIQKFIDHFNNLLKDNDCIFHISFSSQLSSAYNNAILASKEVGEDKICIIDGRTLSTGTALLVIYARKLIDKGLSLNEIKEKVLARVPYVEASFELKRVDYLYKGGRCSAMALIGANLLRIRPQIIVKDGKMVSGKKYRGNYDRIVKMYCDDVLAEFNNPDHEVAFVTYTTASKDIIDHAVSLLKKRGFKTVHITRAGGTIASHCGEDCFGILYLNDGDKN